MCRHCEERSDEAISKWLILNDEIAALRSRPEGWLSHPEEVLLGCNDKDISHIRGSLIGCSL